MTFRTVDGHGRSSFEVRGSTFHGIVDRVRSVPAAERTVDRIHDGFPEATHVVPAYRVHVDGSSTTGGFLREWSSDDGEPSGSAGLPALTVLQGDDLENVVAIVVRYYGGTDLGVGGLVRAYSRAVREAVADAGVVSERPRNRFSATVDYDDAGTVRGVLESVDVPFEASYEERVTFVVDAAVDEAESLRDRLRSATSDRVDLARAPPRDVPGGDSAESRVADSEQENA